ncbi:hypothetical protein CTI14_50805, partial [Methylobacterium radiotolerans]
RAHLPAHRHRPAHVLPVRSHHEPRRLDRRAGLGAQILVGADGSRSYCRHQIPEASRKTYFNAYPFAWFGILTEAPRSSPELIYANSAHGFALISQRTDTVQRMYFQCDPTTNPADWTDEQVW